MQENSKPFVLIGVPILKDCKVNVHTGIFCGRLSLHTNVDFIGKVAHEVSQARNLIIKDFLDDPKYTHLFFLDADTVPPNDAIAKLLGHNKDVIAGVTPMFFNGQKLWSASMGVDDNVYAYMWIPYHCLPDKLFQPYALGGTTILIKRRVIEALEWPYFHTECSPDGRRLGEDVYFTNKIRKAGFQLWCDPSIKCGHFQTRNLAEIL